MKYLLPFLLVLTACSSNLSLSKVRPALERLPINDVRISPLSGDGPVKESMTFNDSRVEFGDNECSLMVYGSTSEAIDRKKAADSISPPYKIIQSRNVVVWLPLSLTTEQQQDYQRTLDSIW